jgi:hypothetical protein
VKAITVECVGGPWDGRQLAVPSVNGDVPCEKELFVVTPVARLGDEPFTEDAVLGVRRCAYDLALTDRDEGPLYLYRYRTRGTLY